MAEPEVVRALAECLEALRRGEPALDECLARHSACRAELEALLDVAARIRHLPRHVAPSTSFVQRARLRLVRPADGRPPLPARHDRPGADPSR